MTLFNWLLLSNCGMVPYAVILEIRQNGISRSNQAIFASRPAVKQAGLGQEAIQHRPFQAGAAVA